MQMTQLQKSWVQGMAMGITKSIEDNKLEVKKNVLSFTDQASIQSFGIEVNDANQIKDNMPYVEYELVKVSQRIFERPIANMPFMDVLASDADGAMAESIVYKFIDYKGGFTVSFDKGASNSIVSTKSGSEAYPIYTLNAYLESVSFRELAVAMSLGQALPERRLRAMYVTFIKAMNKVIFSGSDNANQVCSKYSLNAISGAYVKTSPSTLSALITAGDTTKIYDLFLDVVNSMEENGEKNDGEFTPTDVFLPVKQLSQLKTLMKNTGYFQGSIREWLEKMLNLTFHAYAPLKGAGAGGVDRAIVINKSEENMFYGLPNSLTMFSDQKFDELSNKATFRTSGLILINRGSVAYIDNV